MQRQQNGANCLDCLEKTNTAIEYTGGTNQQRAVIINILTVGKAPLDKLAAAFFISLFRNSVYGNCL